MKRDDLIILLIALLLVAGMLITIFFGGTRSRHGIGMLGGSSRTTIRLTSRPDGGVNYYTRWRWHHDSFTALAEPGRGCHFT